MDKDFSADREDAKHLAAAIDVGRLVTSRPEHNTDTLGLGAAPPRVYGLMHESRRWIGSRLWFLFLSLPWVTIKHLTIYALLFLVPIFLLSQLRFWRSSVWKEYTSEVVQFFQVPMALEWLSSLLSSPEGFVAAIFLTIIWFYALNFIDIFWLIHYGSRERPGILVVPTWVMYQPTTSTSDRIFSISGSNLHFGLLSVWYGFTDEVFFVRSQADHAAMTIDFSIITAVEVDKAAPDGWIGNYNTPPVRIDFDTPGKDKTSLRIHGAYFERNGNGTSRANEFVEALKAAKAAKQKVGVSALPT